MHPKFEVEFPQDGSKPPNKNPTSLHKKVPTNDGTMDSRNNQSNNSFVISCPTKKVHPQGRKKSKRTAAIDYIVDKVSESISSDRNILDSSFEEKWNS